MEARKKQRNRPSSGEDDDRSGLNEKCCNESERKDHGARESAEVQEMLRDKTVHKKRKSGSWPTNSSVNNE